jgi:hypothetical protein
MLKKRQLTIKIGFWLVWLGTLAVSFYWGSTFEWSYDWNWNAISAVATLGVAIIALWPIMDDHLKRQSRAHIVRTRVWHELTELRPTLDQWATFGEDSGISRVVGSLDRGAFNQSVEKVRALFEASDLLEKDEQDQLTRLFVHLSMISKSNPVVPDLAEIARQFLDEARSVFSVRLRQRFVMPDEVAGEGGRLPGETRHGRPTAARAWPVRANDEVQQ